MRRIGLPLVLLWLLAGCAHLQTPDLLRLYASNRSVTDQQDLAGRSEEHTSELQSLMRISYAVFCLQKKTKNTIKTKHRHLTSTPHHKQRHHYNTSNTVHL